MVGRHIWLRAEEAATRPSRGDVANLETDRRTPLVPADARFLVDSGFRVWPFFPCVQLILRFSIVRSFVDLFILCFLFARR